MEDMTKTEAVSALERARTQLRRFKAGSEVALTRASNGAMAVGGAVGAAVLDEKMPTLPGTTFPTKVAVGGIAVALGLADAGGKMSDQLAAFGFGMLSTQAYETTRKALAAP